MMISRSFEGEVLEMVGSLFYLEYGIVFAV
jgi:hypothetical protein